MTLKGNEQHRSSSIKKIITGVYVVALILTFVTFFIELFSLTHPETLLMIDAFKVSLYTVYLLYKGNQYLKNRHITVHIE